MTTAPGKTTAGDRIIVAGGTYNMSNTSYSFWGSLASGSSTAPTIVVAAAGQTPVFDGGNVQGEFMIPSGKSYQVFDGLTVQRFDNQFGNGAITPSSGSHHLTFRNMTFKDNGSLIDNDHDIYIGGCSDSCRVHDISIYHDRFINGPGGALHMWHYREGYNISFYDNLVLNKRVGAYVCDLATNVRIYHNTFVNTTNTGGTTFRSSCGEQAAGAESLYVRNNIIYRAAGTVWERGGPSMVEDHNLFFGGTTSWTLDPSDKRVDPQFVDLAAGDYRLRSTSPAIDAGTATDAAPDDFAGSSRPQGAGYDMGAYEAGGSPPPPPPPADTTPPTAPSNLQASSPSCTTGSCIIHVTWTASTDNVGVDHYVEYRPLTTQVGTDPGSATSTDFGGSLATCSSQTMGLKAVDAAGNVSPMAQITATSYCPGSLVIANLRRDPATDQESQAGLIRFAWDTPSATFTSYNLIVDGNPWWEHPSGTAWWVGSPSWACGSSHTIGIEAVNGSTVGPRSTQTMTTKACS